MIELLTLWIASIVIAGIIGARKGEAFVGIVWGALLGPLGILIAFLVRGDRVECAYCRELMHPEATICPHCRERVDDDEEEEEEEVTETDVPRWAR